LINKINLRAAQQEQQAAKQTAAPPQPTTNAPYTNGEMQPDVAVTGDSVGTIVLAKDE